MRERISKYSRARMTAISEDEERRAERFLLAEYELIVDMRATMIRMVENRMTFVTGLQASEIALLAILITSKTVSVATMLILVCALGIPTLFLTYIVFLRAMDMQVTGRQYLHALNAIREHFVARCPHIRDTIRLPTATHEPRFSSIGSHSSALP